MTDRRHFLLVLLLLQSVLVSGAITLVVDRGWSVVGGAAAIFGGCVLLMILREVLRG